MHVDKDCFFLVFVYISRSSCSMYDGEGDNDDGDDIEYGIELYHIEQLLIMHCLIHDE